MVIEWLILRRWKGFYFLAWLVFGGKAFYLVLGLVYVVGGFSQWLV